MSADSSYFEYYPYSDLEARILRWAVDRDDLRLAIVVGSRARLPDDSHPSRSRPPPSTRPELGPKAVRREAQSKGASLPAADEWSDLDLVFFTTAIQNYTQSGAWLEQFGELWLSWLNNTGKGYPEWFAIYAGGLKLDIALVPLKPDNHERAPDLLAGFAHRDVLSRGLRLILDHTGFQGELPILPYEGHASFPTDEEFQHAVGHFWVTAVKAVKFIQRGEAWRAKQAVDGELKDCLLRLLEWHARCVYRPGQDTWYDGRLIDRWADPRAVAALPATFAVYESQDMKRALLATIELFRWLTAELAAALDFSTGENTYLDAWFTNALT